MKYVIGIDFGTLSARAVLVDIESGEEIAEAIYDYDHAVMCQSLPSGKKLPSDFALQHPEDYLKALEYTSKKVIEISGVSVETVKGICIDFTACTMLPIDKVGVPLCFKPEFADEPHAYVKLWKHHGAQSEADEITELAKARGESWIDLYGGRISSEWAFPKILETLRKAPLVFEAAYEFIDAADWLSLMLTGRNTRARSMAGYKWLYTDAYPSNDFFVALDSRLDGVIGSKVHAEVLTLDDAAGVIDAKGAALTGLMEGTVVALPIIDAHAAMPALNITGDGEMMMILGTSGCYILNYKEGKNIEGTAGYVSNAVLPDVCTYESGQSSLGDSYDWFVKSCVPEDYRREARDKGISIHKLLREKAMEQKAGQSGLLCIDWFNGNRSILADFDLSGAILGLTLTTKPEEIYRAIIEGTAYGARVILDHYENNGIKIKRICAAGGIAQKDEMMMQIFADVLGREISVAARKQAAAYGSALYAMSAVGAYPSVTDAARRFAIPDVKVYTPDKESSAIYEELYKEYKALHDYFAKENGVMKRLKRLKENKRYE